MYNLVIYLGKTDVESYHFKDSRCNRVSCRSLMKAILSFPPGVFISLLSLRLTDKSHTRSTFPTPGTAHCSTPVQAPVQSLVAHPTQHVTSLGPNNTDYKSRGWTVVAFAGRVVHLCSASSCPPQQGMFTPSVIHTTVCFPVFRARSSRDLIWPSL